ncbi:hypothetical protein LS684_04255 [Cytobacillus spongiae]|uniref:hypothetical protein n=1 Tax=Cytobacillus spongiae TaxID=2901381 RepID=UPI001F44B0FB|nr:hypothetical protein [Cytobacillus spongiae]UII56684.1 hypothetical protein LS684_04255 [Cytobacillus spongiae]
MKQSIYLIPAQRELIKTAMRSYRLGLEGIGQRLFDIAYKKVLSMNNQIELDGMEMIYIAQALNKCGKVLSSSGKYREAQIYRQLAQEVECIRIQFQRTNGPKITKEKAASAGTLTA